MKAKPSFMQRLAEAVKAGYPGLVVNSPEVLRIEDSARKTAEQMGYGFKRWTLTRGWQENRTKDGGEPSDAAAALGAVLGKEIPNRSILVFHAYPEMFRDPTVRQLLKDVLAHAKTAAKCLLFVGQFQVPEDLDKELAGLEFDLPTREQLQGIAKGICDYNKLAAPAVADIEKAVESALGLTVQEAENAFSLSLVRNGKLDPATILETKREIVRRSGLLEYIEVKDGLESIGGLDALKAWLRERELGFSAKALEFGLTPPKGVLLAGVPGCGKTEVAKAVSAAWKVPLLKLDMGRVFGGLVGQSESQLRNALKTVESLAPCVLLIDEFEKATAGMGGGSGDSGTTQRVMGSLLSWLQDRPAPVFIIATANKVESVPPEMLRKGRWDELFAVGLPTEQERLDILMIHLRKRGRAKLAGYPNQLREIIEATPGFTGSEIEEAVKAGLWRAFSAGRDLEPADIVAAARATKPLKDTMPETIQAITKWGENRARWASNREQQDSGEGRRLVL